MENVVKVFEQMLIARILPVLINNEVLDLEQFAALPKAGVAAPLRILAEVLDDARLSGCQSIELCWLDDVGRKGNAGRRVVEGNVF